MGGGGTSRRQRREVSTRSFMRHQIYILMYKEEKRQCLNPSSSPYSPSHCCPPPSPSPGVPGPSYSQGLSVCLYCSPWWRGEREAGAEKGAGYTGHEERQSSVQPRKSGLFAQRYTANSERLSSFAILCLFPLHIINFRLLLNLES